MVRTLLSFLVIAFTLVIYCLMSASTYYNDEFEGDFEEKQPLIDTNEKEIEKCLIS